MSNDVTELRAWRNGKGYSLDQVCDLIAAKGVERPSAAKLSRIERDQDIPLDLVPALVEISGIPFLQLRPDIARMLEGEATQ